MRSFAFAIIAATLAVVQAGVVEKRAVTLPPANGKFDYQLGGAYTPPSGTVTVVRDRTASIATGLYNICYINGFQTQPGSEATWWKTNHDTLLLRKSNGQYFEDPDWPGEIMLDTRTAAKRTAIATILNGWIDGCATAGFNAIEPDNLDTWTRSNGLLTKANNLALAKLIADHAHTKNLAIAQKNAAELGSEGKTTAGFDFAVAEECQVWDECSEYTDAYGTAVLEIEYTDNDDADQVFADACADHGSTIGIIHRDRDLVTPSSSDYHYEHC
ncbi:glycoside hydrolase family 114 protein [Coprinopsis sp. MPI-PUGE-AT-0042]|nr:glycoside hydrolase family 114 protein [Coprinopsis sp. MPI-PUGE-AT-0042]